MGCFYSCLSIHPAQKSTYWGWDVRCSVICQGLHVNVCTILRCKYSICTSSNCRHRVKIILATLTLLHSSFVSGDFVNIFEHILQVGVTFHRHSGVSQGRHNKKNYCIVVWPNGAKGRWGILNRHLLTASVKKKKKKNLNLFFSFHLVGVKWKCSEMKVFQPQNSLMSETLFVRAVC